MEQTENANADCLQRRVRRIDEILAAATDMEFQSRLTAAGVAEPRSYCWNNGDPLYRGNPISGRATFAEKRAILKMKTAEETNALLSA